MGSLAQTTRLAVDDRERERGRGVKREEEREEVPLSSLSLLATN